MARVACTAIFATLDLSINWPLLRMATRDASTPEWAAHVTRCYERAFRFCLNEFYVRDIELDYILGHRIDSYAELGAVWSDWVRVRNRRLGTDSIHLSFHFGNVEPRLELADCAGIEAVARFMDMVYQLPETARSADVTLLILGSELSRLACRRQHALGLSRYVFTSLYGLPSSPDARSQAGDGPSEAALTNYYRLLYLHACGADAASARQHVGQAWRSTAFFELYSQPGALLAVSTAYPRDDQNDRPEWFDPAPPQVLDTRTASGSPEQDSYSDYDHLPEYPPLRYLAVPCLEYAAAFEETLRSAQDHVFAVFPTQSPPRSSPLFILHALVVLLTWPWRYIKSVRGASALGRHLLAASLEGVRLPIVRKLVETLLAETRQDRSLFAVTTWNTHRLALAAILISVVALWVTR